MPRMGGKNAQTTFSEFCLSMKQTPATLCLALRVLIDLILNFSIIFNVLQLTALWVNGEPGQAAQQLAEVETRTEPGRCMLYWPKILLFCALAPCGLLYVP